jgi:hypothetical protein
MARPRCKGGRKKHDLGVRRRAGIVALQHRNDVRQRTSIPCRSSLVEQGELEVIGRTAGLSCGVIPPEGRDTGFDPSEVQGSPFVPQWSILVGRGSKRELWRLPKLLFLAAINAAKEEDMRQLLLIGFAACALALAPTQPASAMPVGKQQPVVTNTANDVIQVRAHRGGRGHHYGWSRGRHRGHR